MDFGSSFMFKQGGTQAWLRKQADETSRQAELSKLRQFMEATDEADPVQPIYAKFEDALYAAFRGFLKTERRRARPAPAAEADAAAPESAAAPPATQPRVDAPIPRASPAAEAPSHAAADAVAQQATAAAQASVPSAAVGSVESATESRQVSSQDGKDQQHQEDSGARSNDADETDEEAVAEEEVEEPGKVRLELSELPPGRPPLAEQWREMQERLAAETVASQYVEPVEDELSQQQRQGQRESMEAMLRDLRPESQINKGLKQPRAPQPTLLDATRTSTMAGKAPRETGMKTPSDSAAKSSTPPNLPPSIAFPPPMAASLVPRTTPPETAPSPPPTPALTASQPPLSSKVAPQVAPPELSAAASGAASPGTAPPAPALLPPPTPSVLDLMKRPVSPAAAPPKAAAAVPPPQSPSAPMPPPAVAAMSPPAPLPAAPAAKIAPAAAPSPPAAKIDIRQALKQLAEDQAGQSSATLGDQLRVFAEKLRQEPVPQPTLHDMMNELPHDEGPAYENTTPAPPSQTPMALPRSAPLPEPEKARPQSWGAPAPARATPSPSTSAVSSQHTSANAASRIEAPTPGPPAPSRMKASPAPTSQQAASSTMAPQVRSVAPAASPSTPSHPPAKIRPGSPPLSTMQSTEPLSQAGEFAAADRPADKMEPYFEKIGMLSSAETDLLPMDLLREPYFQKLLSPRTLAPRPRPAREQQYFSKVPESQLPFEQPDASPQETYFQKIRPDIALPPPETPSQPTRKKSLPRSRTVTPRKPRSSTPPLLPRNASEGKALIDRFVGSWKLVMDPEKLSLRVHLEPSPLPPPPRQRRTSKPRTAAETHPTGGGDDIFNQFIGNWRVVLDAEKMALRVQLQEPSPDSQERGLSSSGGLEALPAVDAASHVRKQAEHMRQLQKALVLGEPAPTQPSREPLEHLLSHAHTPQRVVSLARELAAMTGSPQGVERVLRALLTQSSSAEGSNTLSHLLRDAAATEPGILSMRKTIANLVRDPQGPDTLAQILAQAARGSTAARLMVLALRQLATPDMREAAWHIAGNEAVQRGLARAAESTDGAEAVSSLLQLYLQDEPPRDTLSPTPWRVALMVSLVRWCPAQTTADRLLWMMVEARGAAAVWNAFSATPETSSALAHIVARTEPDRQASFLGARGCDKAVSRWVGMASQSVAGREQLRHIFRGRPRPLLAALLQTDLVALCLDWARSPQDAEVLMRVVMSIGAAAVQAFNSSSQSAAAFMVLLGRCSATTRAAWTAAALADESQTATLSFLMAQACRHREATYPLLGILEDVAQHTGQLDLLTAKPAAAAHVARALRFLSAAASHRVGPWLLGWTQTPSDNRILLAALRQMCLVPGGLCDELRMWTHLALETPAAVTEFLRSAGRVRSGLDTFIMLFGEGASQFPSLSRRLLQAMQLEPALAEAWSYFESRAKLIGQHAKALEKVHQELQHAAVDAEPAEAAAEPLPAPPAAVPSQLDLLTSTLGESELLHTVTALHSGYHAVPPAPGAALLGLAEENLPFADFHFREVVFQQAGTRDRPRFEYADHFADGLTKHYVLCPACGHKTTRQPEICPYCRLRDKKSVPMVSQLRFAATLGDAPPLARNVFGSDGTGLRRRPALFSKAR